MRGVLVLASWAEVERCVTSVMGYHDDSGWQDSWKGGPVCSSVLRIGMAVTD
jgi:hypothetical protein